MWKSLTWSFSARVRRGCISGQSVERVVEKKNWKTTNGCGNLLNYSCFWVAFLVVLIFGSGVFFFPLVIAFIWWYCERVRQYVLSYFIAAFVEKFAKYALRRSKALKRAEVIGVEWIRAGVCAGVERGGEGKWLRFQSPLVIFCCVFVIYNCGRVDHEWMWFLIFLLWLDSIWKFVGI